MPAPSRPRPFLARSLAAAFLAAILASAVVPPAARAQEGAPDKARADVPDRRWSAVTAADAGLAGAGLATDPGSSAYANPALWLSAPWRFRLSGSLLSPNRDDLRTSTVDFDEARGFPALAEAAVRFQVKGLGLGAYFAQPHYEHGETRFIGFDPDDPSAGGDPYARVNTWTSATRLAGVGAAMRLQGGIVVGAGAEAVFARERYVSTPDIPPGSFVADTLELDRSGTGIGGVVGVAVPIAGVWTIGASYRVAGTIDFDEGGGDEAPVLGLLGLRWGRTAGSAVHAGVRLLGERTVDFADSNAAFARTADARTEFAAGYAYVDPAGTWTVRLGGALSPRPNDAAVRLTRFGASLGVGGEGLRGAVAYARESESRASGRNSGRNLLLATVELTR